MDSNLLFPVEGPEDGREVQQLQAGAQSQQDHGQQTFPTDQEYIIKELRYNLLASATGHPILANILHILKNV